MSFRESEASVRVNGALLPMYTGQKVVLVGTVEQIDPSGSSLMVKASDGKMVMVSLPNPLQENLEGVIEVHGVGQGQKVMCQSYVTFPQMEPSAFDAQLYDEAIRLVQSVDGNPWKSV
ncbi:replication protein A 14 kDa subunit-like [Portunus trituberculatus]|uniref:replication protein A 14 kDa subunit-like n=1 Tax=Portunus trituberculatus TaxID=210409 RepID=UPI001E1D0AF1|nr:replication protein A 14 kDa subunit-like [Portunus trituberculatus]